MFEKEYPARIILVIIYQVHNMATIILWGFLTFISIFRWANHRKETSSNWLKFKQLVNDKARIQIRKNIQNLSSWPLCYTTSRCGRGWILGCCESKQEASRSAKKPISEFRMWYLKQDRCIEILNEEIYPTWKQELQNMVLGRNVE